MRLGRWHKITFSASLILAGIILIMVIVLLFWHLSEQSQAIDAAKDDAQRTAVEAAEIIEEILVEIPGIAQALADDLTSGKLASDTVEGRLQKDLLAHPDVSAITACYIPELASQQDLYCPYSWIDDDGVPVIVRVED